MAVEAPEKIASAQWVRVLDFARVDSALGEFYAGERERVRQEFDAGEAQAFDVSGPGYSGLVAMRFERRLVDGALQLHIITTRGEGMQHARADLARLAKSAGAVALTSDCEDVAIIRMFARDGWTVESCRMRLDLGLEA